DVSLANDPVSGTDITYDLGDVDANSFHVLKFSVVVRDPSQSGAAQPGQVITTQFSSVTSDSFSQPAYQNPIQLRVLVGTPAHLKIEKVVSHSTLAVGEVMTFAYTVTNTGPLDAQAVSATFGFPSSETCPSIVVDGRSATGETVKGGCRFDLPDLAHGASTH